MESLANGQCLAPNSVTVTWKSGSQRRFRFAAAFPFPRACFVDLAGFALFAAFFAAFFAPFFAALAGLAFEVPFEEDARLAYFGS